MFINCFLITSFLGQANVQLQFKTSMHGLTMELDQIVTSYKLTESMDTVEISWKTLPETRSVQITYEIHA